MAKNLLPPSMEASMTTAELWLLDRRSWNSRRSTSRFVKSNVGEVSVCEIVASVESAAFGLDRTEVEVVTKSPTAVLFVEADQPGGKSGVATLSKDSW